MTMAMDMTSTRVKKRMVKPQAVRARSTVLRVKRLEMLGKMQRQSRKRKRTKSRSRGRRAKKGNKIPLRPQTTNPVTSRMRRKAGAMLRVFNSRGQPKAAQEKASKATHESMSLMQRVAARRELKVIMA